MCRLNSLLFLPCDVYSSSDLKIHPKKKIASQSSGPLSPLGRASAKISETKKLLRINLYLCAIILEISGKTAFLSTVPVEIVWNWSHRNSHKNVTAGSSAIARKPSLFWSFKFKSSSIHPYWQFLHKNLTSLSLFIPALSTPQPLGEGEGVNDGANQYLRRKLSILKSRWKSHRICY